MIRPHAHFLSIGNATKKRSSVSDEKYGFIGRFEDFLGWSAGIEETEEIAIHLRKLMPCQGKVRETNQKRTFECHSSFCA